MLGQQLRNLIDEHGINTILNDLAKITHRDKKSIINDYEWFIRRNKILFSQVSTIIYKYLSIEELDHDDISRMITAYASVGKDIVNAPKGKSLLPSSQDIINKWEDIIENKITCEFITFIKCMIEQGFDTFEKRCLFCHNNFDIIEFAINMYAQIINAQK